MERILKILGKKGRITIPFEIRQRLGFHKNDIISFVDDGKDTVTVKRELICSHCRDEKEAVDKPDNEETLLEFLDSLSLDEQRAALIHLSVICAQAEKEKKEAEGGKS